MRVPGLWSGVLCAAAALRTFINRFERCRAPNNLNLCAMCSVCTFCFGSECKVRLVKCEDARHVGLSKIVRRRFRFVSLEIPSVKLKP